MIFLLPVRIVIREAFKVKIKINGKRQLKRLKAPVTINLTLSDNQPLQQDPVKIFFGKKNLNRWLAQADTIIIRKPRMVVDFQFEAGLGNFVK